MVNTIKVLLYYYTQTKIIFRAGDVFFFNCFLLVEVGAIADGAVNSWTGGHGYFIYMDISSP